MVRWSFFYWIINEIYNKKLRGTQTLFKVDRQPTTLDPIKTTLKNNQAYKK